MEKKETIFALSTPYGRSAIAVIRLSGPNSLNVAKKITKKEIFHIEKLLLLASMTAKDT